MQPAPTFSIDFSGLANTLINGFTDALGNFFAALPNTVAQNLNDQVQRVWDALWTSDGNIFVTPHDLITGFPPVVQLFHALVPAVYGIAYCSVVLLGMVILFKPVLHHEVAEHALRNTLMGAFLGGAGWLIADQTIVVVGHVSSALGRGTFVDAPQFGLNTALVTLFTLPVIVILGLIVLVFAARLAYRFVYRTVLLAFLAPFAPVFGALFGIPQLRPVASLYWWTYAGWAAGGILGIAALTLGVQVAFGHQGIWGFLFGLAVLGLAHDIVPWLGRGALVAHTPGLRPVVGAAIDVAGGPATAAATGGATSASAASASYGYD